MSRSFLILPLLTSFAMSGCASQTTLYRDTNVDFGRIESVAVLPFQNLSRQQLASERVYDVVSAQMLARGAFYVVPRAEVDRALRSLGITDPTSVGIEDIKKLRQALIVDAVVTGIVREYDELRADRAAGNAVSLSLRMFESLNGKVIWAASTSRGGVGFSERLLGGGGQPMNEVTEEAADELLRLLFE